MEDVHYIMRKMIDALPEENRNDFGFIVSVSFAQSLFDHRYELTKSATPYRIIKCGDEFTYMGIKCKCL